MKDLKLILAKNLKKIRDNRGLSLDKVAALTKVSKSMLGQIERGESNPTVGTVWKIANGLHISFTSLVKEHQSEHVMIRKEEVDYFDEDNGKCQVYPYFTYEDGRPYEVYQVRMQAQGKIFSGPHPPQTTEIITVYSGEVTVYVKDKVFTLTEGDAISFMANSEHIYENTSDVETRLSVYIYYGQTHI